MAWVACHAGERLPLAALQVGESQEVGVLFVGRTVEGDAQLGTVATTNGCIDGFLKRLRSGGKNFERFQVLCVTPQARARWLVFNTGQALPEKAFLACHSGAQGALYIGRDGSGLVGPISTSRAGGAEELEVVAKAFSPEKGRRNPTEGEVLAIATQVPAACGARFVLKGTVLARSKKLFTVWKGQNSHLRYQHSASYQQAAATQQEQENSGRVAAEGEHEAEAQLQQDAGAGASAGLDASAGAQAEAKAQGDAGLGGGLVGFLGGPTIKAFADAGGFAKVAAHAAAEAALSVAGQASESAGAEFAKDFFGVISTATAVDAGASVLKQTVERHVGTHTEGQYEVKEIDNSDSERSLFVYQLFLWVQYEDGHERTMATLLVETTRSGGLPELKPNAIQQFGLPAGAVLGSPVEPRLAAAQLAQEALGSSSGGIWTPFAAGLPLPRGALLAGRSDFGELFVGRDSAGLIGTLSTTTGDRDGPCKELSIHRRGYFKEYEGFQGRFWEKKLDAGEVLVMEEKFVEWLDMRTGEPILPAALRVGFEAASGPLYVGRGEAGLPGKLTVAEGRAAEVWSPETNTKSKAAQVLALRQRNPVKCGAEFQVQKSVLPRTVEKITLMSGSASERSWAESLAKGQEQAKSSKRESSWKAGSAAAGQAGASGAARAGGQAGADASLSVSAGASLQEKIEASIGGGLWSFFGGPHAETSEELRAAAYAALKAGFAAAVKASLGLGAATAGQFTLDFVQAAMSTSTQSADSGRSCGSVTDHVLGHSSGMEETVIVSNEDEEKGLFVYQLYLWVKFEDGSVDRMGTPLMTTSRSDTVPAVHPEMLRQFGL